MSASACGHCGPVVCNWLHIVRNLEVKLCPRIMQGICATFQVMCGSATPSSTNDNHTTDHATDDLAVEYDDKYFPIIKSFTIQDTPTPKRGPRPYSLAWFRSYKPPLPPHLQAPFPFNIVRVRGDPSNESFTDSICTVLTPILLPIILILMLIRISISSYHSRSRIRLLESEDASATRRLVHVFGQLERRVEDIVANMADDPATPAPSPNGSQAAKVALRVTPAQRRMVAACSSTALGIHGDKQRKIMPTMRAGSQTIDDAEEWSWEKAAEESRPRTVMVVWTATVSTITFNSSHIVVLKDAASRVLEAETGLRRWGLQTSEDEPNGRLLGRDGPANHYSLSSCIKTPSFCPSTVTKRSYLFFVQEVVGRFVAN
ncbi:hypothetical protein EDB84DRAFT_1680082 [Lactarius hengduanensis]|nr:hypothetical protein EDB84DRAFT_1680082 [Lactarius hengduanensis]